MAEKYGIRIRHETGPAGWVAAGNCSVMLFSTRKEAEQALGRMKQDPHYIWKCEAEISEFTGFRK